MRKVLGSSQQQLFWQFITEIIVIIIITISLTLFFGYISIPTLNDCLKTEIGFSQLFDTKLLIFVSLLLIFIVIIAGIYPSYVISNFNAIMALKGNNQGFSKGVSLRKALISNYYYLNNVLLYSKPLIISRLTS